MHYKKVEKYIVEHDLLSKGDTVVVAVSGGADSQCLLTMLKDMSDKYSLKIIVAHLNHCLRPEANEEQLGVQEYARSMNLEFETRATDVRRLKNKHKISEEVAGRLSRYRFLLDMANKYNATKIALGHHMDDQAETVLQNILRGTGIDGLSGIMPKCNRGRVQLIRPLLCLRRCDIEEYCMAKGLDPYTDKSNFELCYTRNRVRIDLIPYLEKEYNPKLKEGLNNLSVLALHDRQYFRNKIYGIYRKIARSYRNKIIIDKRALSKLPPSLAGRIVYQALKRLGNGLQFNYSHIKQVMNLVSNSGSRGPAYMPGNIYAYSFPNTILFRKGILKKVRQEICMSLSIPGKTFINSKTYIMASIVNDKSDLQWPPGENQAYIDLEGVNQEEVMVKYRWEGAKFYPQGASGGKKLKDFFIDNKIPHHKRDTWPLVTINDIIIWVVGLRVNEKFKVRETTRNILVLEYHRN